MCRCLILIGLLFVLAACSEPTPTPTPTATPTPTPAPERTRGEIVKLLHDMAQSSFSNQKSYIADAKHDVDSELPFATGDARLKALDFSDWLDAYQKDVEACEEVLESDPQVEWEPEDRTWRITYAIGDREAVYRWFERLELEDKNPLDVVEGCQTVSVRWEYLVWRDGNQ